MNKKLIIAICIIFLLCSIGVIGIHLKNISYFDPKFHSSNQGLVIIQQENKDTNSITYYYCIFDKNKKCTASFCEMINPSEDMHIDENLTNGYIKPKKIDNTLYTEYTGLRGLSYDEILDMFKNDTVLKSW